MSRKASDLSKLTEEELEEFRNRYEVYFFDKDGCLTLLFGESLDGVQEALNEIVKRGLNIQVITDNTLNTLDEISTRINQLLPAIRKEDVMSSGHILGMYLKEIKFNRKIYVVGQEEGLVKELADFGFEVLCDTEVKKITVMDLATIKLDTGVGAVAIGIDLNFNVTKMYKAVNYVADPEVLFFETHCHKTVDTVLPGMESISVPVKVSSGRKDAICTGKGSLLSIKYLKSLGYPMERCLFVGDQLSTDIHTGNLAGMDTLLVLSGECSLEDVEKAEKNNQDTYIPTYYTNSVADLYRVFKQIQ